MRYTAEQILNAFEQVLKENDLDTMMEQLGMPPRGDQAMSDVLDGVARSNAAWGKGMIDMGEDRDEAMHRMARVVFQVGVTTGVYLERGNQDRLRSVPDPDEASGASHG